MKPHRLPFRVAYNLGHESLAPFFSYLPGKFEWADVLAERAKFSVNRPALVAALQADELFTSHPNVLKNIALLENEDTFTVTTGQQPGLFGGPLYVAYKAAAVINWCRTLKQHFPNKNFVPIFWTATEDHDAAEVNHTWLRYPFPTRYTGNFQGGPVGIHRLDDSVRLLWPDTHGALARHYQPGLTFGDAFRNLLLEMFGNQGLVVIEPAQSRLKSLFSKVVVDEIDNQHSEPAFNLQSEALTLAGYSPQAQSRAINLFYMGDGPRVPIEPASVTPARRAEAAAHPERFSPNVVLRPVYQEAILPNLAYIGGWGEIAYWAQLQGVFKAYGVFFPVVLPRPSAVGLPMDGQEVLAKAGLSISSILDTEFLLRQLFHKQVDSSLFLANAQQQLEAILSTLETQVGSVVALRRDVSHQMQRLARRVRNAAENSRPEWKAARELKQHWLPDGFAQERSLNASLLYQNDPATFGKFLVDRLDVRETAQQAYFYTSGETMGG